MPCRNACSWLWMVVVVALAVFGLRSTSSAIAGPRHGRIDAPSTGTVAASTAPQERKSRVDAQTFESLRIGAADENLPPEALRMLALQTHTPDVMTQAPEEPSEELEEAVPEYDPWERFNRAMFAFNRKVDRYVLKPVAQVWNAVLPDLVQQSFNNAFENIAMPRRFINNLLQLKIEGAGRELARFLINISMGVGGFFDAASEVGVSKSDEDMGLTLGHYGVGPGPYLVLPFLPPSTVRDTVGFAADIGMDPRTYLVPLAANAGVRGGEIVNTRSLNLETFEEFERATFDLYSAVRNAYLQRRQRALEE